MISFEGRAWSCLNEWPEILMRTWNDVLLQRGKGNGARVAMCLM